MNDSVHVLAVHVHTWPARTDVVVADARDGAPLARFDPLDVPPIGASAALDVHATADSRVLAALAALERDQDLIAAAAGVADGAWVSCSPESEPMASYERILAEHGLQCADVEFHCLDGFIAEIDSWPLERLWALTADMWDRAELHYPAGTSRSDAASWLWPARPSARELLIHDPDPVTHLRELVDRPIGPFGLQHVLLWRYLARSELADMSVPRPRALHHPPLAF